MLRVRPARLGDASELASRLRAADLREIQAVTMESPLSTLEGGIKSSDPCYAVVQPGDRPLAVFGVIPDQGDTGVVWLLGSDDLIELPLLFLRSSRKWTEKLHEHYRTLWNVVDARNEVHVRWLQWCGFTIRRTIEDYGVERRPFHEFFRTHDR